MHGAAVPERGKTFGCHHAWNGRSDCAARCAVGIRNRQTAVFVAGERI